MPLGRGEGMLGLMLDDCSKMWFSFGKSWLLNEDWIEFYMHGVAFL